MFIFQDTEEDESEKGMFGHLARYVVKKNDKNFNLHSAFRGTQGRFTQADRQTDKQHINFSPQVALLVWDHRNPLLSRSQISSAPRTYFNTTVFL